MKAAAFDYVRAASIGEAVDVLAAHEGAKVLAGGQSLVPLLNLRLARPSVLVDVNRLGELAYLDRYGGYVEIGALTRLRAVETSEVVRRDVPLLAEALRHVGHVTIRNRGTIGGSLAHADPAAELPAVCVALDAEFVARGPRGERAVAARDFFAGPFRTALEPDELLVRVRVPVLPGDTGNAVEELSRRSKDLALVAVFAAMTPAADGTCEQARIAVAGAGPVPVRAVAAEALLAGREVTAEVIAEAGWAIAAATDPPGDLHAPAEYRREMAAVLGRRAIQRACLRVNGGA
jgi:carbon-monoxide dehydrogenase medium subunit